ncbi:hypothetical protein OTU49_001304 [Cherax quadricarinatus]|uniref:Mediator of RNA polymerase II transcription subunit 18 n=1 Tax=Cherax quadricarinatus TaxID=27406 RepID=A0AAW0XVA3_CHEQU
MALPMSVPHVGETIESAIKNQIVPDQEFLLQGSVLDTSLGVVIDRLRGLCDNADIPPETFHDHEVVYLLKDFNAPVTPGPAAQGVMLRVRRAVDHPELPYQLRYVGYPELGIIQHCYVIAWMFLSVVMCVNFFKNLEQSLIMSLWQKDIS